MRIRALFLAALFAGAAWAADVTGKWKAEFTTPDGSTRTNDYDFKQSGEKLTGTVASQAGEAPIQNGKISGDDISFSVVRNFQGQEVTLTYKGKVKGDEMNLTVEFGGSGQSFEITAKRLPT